MATPKQIKTRGVIKAQVTRMINVLKTTPDLAIGILEENKGKLRDLEKSFLDIQFEIEMANNDDPNYSDEVERTLFEKGVYECLSLIDKNLRSLSPSTSQATVASPQFNNEITVRQVHNLLPNIKITPFDGNPIEWCNFHDTFKSLVHENVDLPSVQKFHHLKNSLKGEVASVISSLNASEENYLVAWDLLQKRCDRPRQIVQAHLKSLLGLPEITRESPSLLRNLYEKAQLHVEALKTLKLPIEHWNAFLVYIISSKLDKTTRRAWERTLENKDMPTFDDLIRFLAKQSRGEEIDFYNSIPNKTFETNRHHSRNQARVHVGTFNQECPNCNENHYLFQCRKFIDCSVNQRFQMAKKLGLCLNCLKKGHCVSTCSSPRTCKTCHKKHHSLLHFQDTKSREETVSTGTEQLVNSLPSTSALVSSCESEVLLGTALITIFDKDNKERVCRVLLDSGSQTNFITEDFAKLLGLRRHLIDIPFSGLVQLQTTAKYTIHTKFASRTTPFTTPITFVAIPSITGHLPSQHIDNHLFTIPRNVRLADPRFNQSAGIDALLGNELFYKLLCVGQIKLQNNIVLQKTLLGWIVTGAITTHPNTSLLSRRIQHCHVTTLSEQVAKFWEIEELQFKKRYSAEEMRCENYFCSTTTRGNDGKFVVKLPFNDKKHSIGDSYNIALKRLFALERKLNKDTNLRAQYVDFLRDYLDSGHMTEITHSDNKIEGFYLPHHAVVKESSLTTKVRVVFDGSAKSSSGISLNDTLLVGPTIQDELVEIMMRFRMYTHVLIADIKKMFRQIWVSPDDAIFQKILWRETDNSPIRTFRLNTVTYGTASAPFLAVRSLHHLADEHQETFSLASPVIKNDFYMDDLITGTNNLHTAVDLRDQLIKLLHSAGFELRQWASNTPSLISELENSIETDIHMDSEQFNKILGLKWNYNTDSLIYHIEPFLNAKTVTKRTILSKIAQLFDPLGLLGPVITRAKLIMQELWRERLDWDESVPQTIHTSWEEFRTQLTILNNFKVPRKILLENYQEVQLHGFCDASERAYGACIYLRSSDNYNQHFSKLVCSKSRVAPLKSVTLPRLELCAAVLLARLFQKTKSALKINNYSKVRFWSDSTIALQWIKSSPHLLKTFVANRVAEVQELTNPDFWHHISSSDNPSDLISRGQTPSDFISADFWLYGPWWLIKPESEWPTSVVPFVEVPEKRAKVTLTTTAVPANTIFNRFSSINAINRFVAYGLRWTKFKKGCPQGELNVAELHEAHIRVLKLTQAETFGKELISLQAGKTVDKKSQLLSLNPFIDEAIKGTAGNLLNGKFATRQGSTSQTIRKHWNRLLWPLIKEKKIKNKNKLKAYIVAVVCFATKAVHFELVTDLTTESCLAALKRLFARRGLAKNIYSDNATNFIGCRNEVLKLKQLILSQQFNDQMKHSLSELQVDWHFAPPRAPHFGGLWEASVKSVKTHLYRTIGNNLFTYEQFYTLVVEVEAILNSRPLTPLSSNPEDLLPLTPSHFLIGSSLKTIPELDWRASPSNRLSLWQHIQRVKQHFWARWSREYLQQLQTRSKWKEGSSTQIKVGTLVIIKEENLPPLQWRLGRIIAVHPGSDSVVRVATVKTSNGIYKRGIKFLCPLPVE